MRAEEYPSGEEIAARAAQAAFGRPLITNVHRGLIVEAIVADALGDSWRWCSADYSAWDFEHETGVRLEVKQAASRQSWHDADSRPSRISFDIRVREGRHDGALWIEDRRRWADIYVFAHHKVIDNQADHRDPSQWCFYVAPTSVLPNQGRIALSRVREFSNPARFGDLRAVVAALLDGV